MKTILHFSTRYFPAISGAELYFQRISEVLSETYSCEIEIYCSDALDFSALTSQKGKRITSENKYFKKVNNLTINRIPINYNQTLDEQISFIKKFPSYESLSISREILELFLKNGPNISEILNYFEKENEMKYDLIHSTYLPYLNNLISLVLGKMYNIPTVCTPFFHFANQRYQNPFYFELLKKFDMIICCTSLEKRYLIKNGVKSEKIEVVPMGIDLEYYEKCNKINFKRTFFGNKQQKSPMILFCGNKNFEKGAISLLKAIPLILKNKKNVIFTFIGPSTEAFNRELKKVKKLKNKYIVNLSPSNLKGYFDIKKISAFRECDIYVMPSRSDAFGISFLEAWVFKKPVIGANIGSTPEVIDNGKNGLLVEFDNTEDICSKIVYLLKNKKYAKQIGKAGYQKIKDKNYLWSFISEKIFKIYNKLIEGNNF